MTNTAPRTLPTEQSGTVIQTASSEVSPIRYVLYARKSSEDDERQALSIDSQVKEMLTVAEHQGIIIAEIRTESHSAKYSGQRPVFNQLIEDIRSGLFDGVLTWATDRLSRNAGDLGSVLILSIVVDYVKSAHMDRHLRTHRTTSFCS